MFPTTRLEVVPVQLGVQTPGAVFLGLLSNARVHIWNSVAVTTRKTYSVGWNRWREFTFNINTDVGLTFVPGDIVGHLEGLGWKEACFMAFLSYLRDGNGTHGAVEPNTVSNYLHGARFFLKQLNVDTSIVESSPAIRTELHGMRLAFRAADGNKVADRVRLPFTLDLIEQCVTFALNKALLVDRFTAVALKMGVGCLFRKCEYIKCADTDHHLRARDVEFVMEWPPGTTTFVPAPAARDLSIAHLREVILFVRSAKNDFEGVGNKICFKVRAITPTVPFCLASEMFVLNADARPMSEHPFLSYRGQWSYDVAHHNTAIKRTVVRIGLDPKRFDSVSLRIAGACILASANVPDYLIKKAGRWKSDVFLRYIRMSVNTHELIASTIFSLSSLSFAEVRRVAPGITNDRVEELEEVEPPLAPSGGLT